jgi:hypothetical protein
MVDYVKNWTVPFGKYRGKTYEEMEKDDPSYARWYSTITKSTKVKAWLGRDKLPTEQDAELKPDSVVTG